MSVSANEGAAMTISRRAMLAGGALLLGGGASAKGRLKVSVFSKHLQFLQGEDLAKAVAGIGFDGVDLAVRKGGHVEPATVAKDLPPAVETLRRNGLEVPMITTEIADAETPYAEDVLKAAAALGIRYYRFGAFKWDAGKPYAPQLEAFKPRLAKLAALNGKYQTCAMYHTHSGAGLVGASIWDLWYAMKELDPRLVGINYDVGHATVEGGLGGWIASFGIAGKYVRGIALKDVKWEKDAKGTWREAWQPIGEGMVKFPQFFKMVAETDFAGPLQMHFEYPLGGANNGTRTPTIPKEEIYAAMKRDLGKVRGMLAQAAL
jgi:sugar phosphate isomerase/epimerase